MNTGADAIEVETAADPEFAVIWMHGLGADGSDFLSAVPEFGLPKGPGVRFIFPNAPCIPVTVNGGYVMPAWYDILELDSHSRTVDEQGIRASREFIRRLIKRENDRGIASKHIVLAGFSQGGAMAYVTALTHPERLAGLMALSAYIPSPTLIEGEHSNVNLHLPIFIAHGTEDSMVAPALGGQARSTLERLGHDYEWHDYLMGHEMCQEEARDIGVWLAKRFASKSDSVGC